MNKNSRHLSTTITGELGRVRKYDYKELGLALLIFVVLGLTAALSMVLIRQNTNGNTLHDVKQSNDILIDCTTPGHPCYERNKDGTALLVKELNKVQKAVIIAAAHCVTIGNYSIPAITNCVNRSLK